MPYQNMESRHLPGGTGRVLGRGRLCGGIALFGYDVGGSLPAEEKTNVFFPIAGIVPNKPWLYKNGLSYWVLVLRPGWKDLPASKNEVDAIVRLLDSEDVETSSIPARRVRRNRSGGLSKRKASVLHLARIGSICIGIQG